MIHVDRRSRLELVCVVVGYGPSEGDDEERDRFWKYMHMILDRVGKGYILCILRDLNGWIEDRREAVYLVLFGVPGKNDLMAEEWQSYVLKWNCV